MTTPARIEEIAPRVYRISTAFPPEVMPGGFTVWDGAQPGHIDNRGMAPGSKCALFSVADAPKTYRFFQFCENFPGAGSFTTLPTLTVPNFDDGLGDVPQPGGDNATCFFMNRLTLRRC